MIVLKLDLTPAANQLDRMHRWKITRLKRKWRRDLITQYLMLGKGIPLANGFRKLEVIRYSSNICDKDNLYRAAKPIIDTLKGVRGTGHLSGWIVDDSPKHINLICSWEKCAGHGWVEIRITDPLEKEEETNE